LGLEIDTTDQFIVFIIAGCSDERWDSLKYVNNKLQFVKGLNREIWNDRSGLAWQENSYSKMISSVIITNVDSSSSKRKCPSVKRILYQWRFVWLILCHKNFKCVMMQKEVGEFLFLSGAQ
jgi:hypothetical protein